MCLHPVGVSMRLIPNWRWALWRLWSVRVSIAAALNGAAMGLMAFMGVIPPWWFFGLSVALPVLAIVVRAIKQPKLD